VTPEARLATGAALAALVATGAARLQLLTPGGASGAFATGTAAAVAGWRWCVVLLAFFIASAALSRWRRARKDAATGDVVDKAGARDLPQVVANGGVFAGCAVAAVALPSPAWEVAALGALAAATADTWATEVGTAVGRSPRAILGFDRVPPGTSGAVSAPGTAAMAAGALFTGTVSALAGFDPRMAVAAIAGGVTGALVDTLLGATIQERRWCASCRRATEQRVHRCGRATSRAGGWALMTNDAVNLTSTACGALAALAAGGLWR
jgi:uncharacterized protein (TIGR00297 family)